MEPSLIDRDGRGMVGVAFGEYLTRVHESELPDLCDYGWLFGQWWNNDRLQDLEFTWRTHYECSWEPLANRVLLDVVHRL